MKGGQSKGKGIQRVTSADGTKIAYDVRGSGPALVYITGASCFRQFAPILADAKVFSQNFTVYNFDRRGRGDSSDTQPYSLEKEIDDIEAMINAAGGKAFLYGHSSGAILALEAALRLKDQVTGVVVYDPSYVHTEAEKHNYKHLSNTVLSLLAKKKHKQAMKVFLSGIGMPGIFVWLLPVFPGWKTMHKLAPTLAYDIELTNEFPPLKRLGNLKSPLLVLAGSKSPERIRTVASQIAASVPGCGFEELTGQNHMVSAKILLPKFIAFLT